jgi:hypothetical protein
MLGAPGRKKNEKTYSVENGKGKRKTESEEK